MQDDTDGRLRQALTTERMRRRMSQADAAAMVGRSRKWLSDYECGRTDPSAATLFKLALRLGIAISISGSEEIRCASPGG